MSTTSATSKANEALRVKALRALATAFRQPTLWQPEEIDAFQATFAEFGEEWQAPTEQLALAWAEAFEHRDDCEVCFSQLFLGPFNILAPPYASSYLEPGGGLMEQTSSFAEQCYLEAGLALGDHVREAPDHIAVELDFLQFLAQQLAENPTDELVAVRWQFLEKHLLRWLPLFAEQIRTAAVHPFYDALAAFMTTAIHIDRKIGKGPKVPLMGLWRS